MLGVDDVIEVLLEIELVVQIEFVVQIVTLGLSVWSCESKPQLVAIGLSRVLWIGAAAPLP